LIEILKKHLNVFVNLWISTGIFIIFFPQTGGSIDDIMKITKMFYRFKRLYLEDLFFNDNIHLGHLLGETVTLPQKFVILCRTVSESIA